MIVPRNSSSGSQGVLISNERYFLKGRFQSEGDLEHEKNGGQRLIGRGGRSGPRECASTREPESDRESGTCLSGDGQEIPPNGIVKVQIVIAPDGRVKETKIIGGHPLLVNTVEETLKNWKYAPASAETTAQLEFNFHP